MRYQTLFGITPIENNVDTNFYFLLRKQFFYKSKETNLVIYDALNVI